MYINALLDVDRNNIHWLQIHFTNICNMNILRHVLKNEGSNARKRSTIKTASYTKYNHSRTCHNTHLHNMCIFRIILVRVTCFIALTASLDPKTRLRFIHIVANPASLSAARCILHLFQIRHIYSCRPWITCKSVNNAVTIQLMIPGVEYLIFHKILWNILHGKHMVLRTHSYDMCTRFVE